MCHFQSSIWHLLLLYIQYVAPPFWDRFSWCVASFVLMCGASFWSCISHFLYFVVRVFSVCVLLRISCSLSRFLFTFVVAYVFFYATSSSIRKFYSLFLCLFVNVIEVKTVGEFSLICCTSMGHAGNTKIWAKIIFTRAPNAATKPTNLEKSSYSPQSQWYGQTHHTKKQPGGGYKSVKEFIFPQTSAET